MEQYSYIELSIRRFRQIDIRKMLSKHLSLTRQYIENAIIISKQPLFTSPAAAAQVTRYSITIRSTFNAFAHKRFYVLGA